MTRTELINKYYDMACHNLLCYSKNYAMTVPKDGFEADWKQANEECNLLQEMMKEYVEAHQKETASLEEAAHEKINKLKKQFEDLKLVEIPKIEPIPLEYVCDSTINLSRMCKNAVKSYEI